MLKSALGAVFNVKLEVAEAVLGVLPIFVSTKINSIKHILKLNIFEDMDKEPDPLKEFICDHLQSHKHSLLAGKIKDAYQFLVWKAHHFPINFNKIDRNIITNDVCDNS